MEFVVAVLFLGVIVVAILLMLLGKRVRKLEQIVAELAVKKTTPAQTSPEKPHKVQPTAAKTAAKTARQPVRKSATLSDAINQGTDPWGNAAARSQSENSEVLRNSGHVSPPVKVAKPTRYVFKPGSLSAAMNWARLNWFYLVAAASLGLAGVFLVQYGVENGILPPKIRVLAALVLGGLLIGFGEYLRRRGGVRPDDLFAYLPSTFAAGGLLALFAGVMSAHVLYGLIAAETALIGLALVGLLAVVIGWFYGPLLAAVGILGAVLAPFLVAGNAESADLLYGYFAVIALVGMAVDTLKRWAWLSAFSTILTIVAAANIFAAVGGGLAFLAFGLVVTLAAATIPERRLIPQHAGTMLLEELRRSFRRKPEPVEATGFPTRLIAGVFAATTLATIWVFAEEINAFWLAVTTLLILFAMAAIWMRRAPALGDLALLPLFSLPIVIFLEAADRGPVFKNWIAAADRVAEDPAPWTLTILLAIGLAVSLVAAWRSYFGAPYRNSWALGAAAFAPVIVVVLELSWQPSRVIGADNWAYYVIGIAALMVLLAERFARRMAGDHTAAAYFTLAAMTMISLALILMLSSAALTLALAVMVLAATLLDRRFNLPALAVFVTVGTLVISWRLVLDPGVFWAMDAPLWEVAATYVATLLLLWATRLLLRPSPRRLTFGVVDGVFWSLSAVFATILILRLMDHFFPGKDDSHAAASLVGMVWLVSAANQLWRLQYNELRNWVRITLASLYALPGFAMLTLSATYLNPLFLSWEPVFGPYVLDSLLVAYAIPAVFFLSLATWFKHLPNWMRGVLAGLGIGFATLYVGLEIRRIWRGNDLTVPGTTDPELYTYTVVMLLAATALLFYSFYRHNNLLRKIALAGIGLTVAKVFLIDVSGLTGLTRVFSFLVLGLSLAGLAWLDRWFGAKAAPAQSPEQAPE